MPCKREAKCILIMKKRLAQQKIESLHSVLSIQFLNIPEDIC